MQFLKTTSGFGKLTFSKFLLYYIFLFFCFIVSYRVLLNSTIYPLIKVLEIVYLAGIFLYLAYRLLKRSVSKNFKINSFEALLILLSTLPFISAIAARFEFGQPIVYGLATSREFYFIYGGLVIYNMLKEGEVSIDLVERAFLGAVWFNLIFFYFLSLFTNPSAYKDTGLAGSNTAKGGDVYYRFNMSFVFMGSIYYTVKAFLKKNYINLLYASFFIIYLVFFRLDRTSIFVVFASLGLFFVTGLSIKQQALSIIKVGVPGVLLLGIIILAFPEILEKYLAMFSDVIATLLGKANEDGKESVRLHELNVAIKYIAKNPIIGNGKVSPSWVEGGYNHFLGFFYASDIGVVGQVFVFGFVGATILYSQFLFSLYYVINTHTFKSNVFFVSSKFYLLAMFMDSITNGYLTLYAAQTLTVIAFIYYFYKQSKTKQFE